MAEETQSANTLLDIEVVYARPNEQSVIKLTVPNGTTTEQALQQSGLLICFSELNKIDFKLGVFGAVCKPDYIVKDGDRVEIYRPLLNDPKDARRQRALKK